MRREEALDKPLSEAIYTKGHMSNKFALVRDHCRRTYEDVLKTCEKCGYAKHVEFCHIKPLKEFPPTATIREVNARTNILALCPNCHWEFDHLSI